MNTPAASSSGSGLARAAAVSAIVAAIVASRTRRPASAWMPCVCQDSPSTVAKGAAGSPAQTDSDELFSAGMLSTGVRGGEKQAAMFRAVKGADMNRAVKLLPFMKDIDEPLTVTGESALGLACAAGYVGMADWLINEGADPRITDLDGTTCLAMACAEGHANMIDRLMADERVDAAQADAFGLAPIHKATIGGHEEALQILLQYGVDASLVTADDAKETALHMLAKTTALRKSRERERRRNVMRMLLRFNARVLSRDAEGDTPLHIAARRGDIWSLWLMLGSLQDAGAAISIANRQGNTLLAEAKSWGVDAVLTVWAAVYFNPLRQWWNRNWIMASGVRNVVLCVLFFLFFRRQYRAVGSPV